MSIQENAFVSIDYRLTSDSGEQLDCSEPKEPLGFVFGKGQLLQAVEDELLGKDVGFETKLTVEADDGYGAHRPELVKRFPRSNFPEEMEIEPGMVFHGTGPHGPVVIRVAEVLEEEIVGDLNHPLAGERLHFEIKVVEIREATEHELHAAEGKCSDGGCGGCDHKHEHEHHH